jgi:transposase
MFQMPHLQGVSRDTTLLFPPALDDYIAADNPVRFIDAFVDQLDLHALGFQGVVAAVEGRPAYSPMDLLKLYIYGYLNRVRSSRSLEREAHRNVEVIWLLKKLTPDHKTIADFRKIHATALQPVCREFGELCKALELFGGEWVAIDGSKFLAVNSRAHNFSQEKLKQALQAIEAKLQRYLAELAAPDASAPEVTPTSAEALQEKIAQLQTRQVHYQQLQQQLARSGETQLSLIDPDSRSMPARQGTVVAYNVQTAVDSKHKLIVAHDVTNAVTDQNQLAGMACRAKAVLGVETLAAIADQGYFDGAEVKRCLEAGITPYVAKPHTSVNELRGLYTKADFTYDASRDVYRCPQGAELPFRFETIEAGRLTRYYRTAACHRCPAQALCTRSKDGRRIKRWTDEHLLEAMAERVAANPSLMKLRKTLAEHPFGTLKRGMNQGYFLLRRLVKVRGEMALSVLAYNLKRVITILGVAKLIAAVT